MFEDAPIRVVLADDEDAVLALVGITLLLDGDYAVVGEAHDGAEAVTLVERCHPDAVVLDLMMPVMSGMDAIPRIKALAPETKIVVFSALGAELAREEAETRGADAYVEKSKFVAELSGTLKRLCCAAA